MKTLKLLLLILIETDPVFLASKCGIQNACAPTPTSLGPEDMDDRRLSSISAAVDWAKTNNLLGVFLDADLLVSDALCPSPLSYLLFCPLALIIKTFFFPFFLSASLELTLHRSWAPPRSQCTTVILDEGRLDLVKGRILYLIISAGAGAGAGAGVTDRRAVNPYAIYI